MHPAHEEDEAGGESLSGQWRSPAQPDDEQDERQQDARCHGCHAEPLRQLEREDRETGDRVQGQAEHLLERVFRLAGGAGVTLVRHADLPEADPRDHRPHKAVPLAHPLEGLERVAVEQAEVPGLHRDDDVGERLDDAVEQPRGEELEPRLAFAFGAHGVDHLVAFAPLGDQIGDDLRRVLQVGVDDDDGVAARVIHPGGDRNLVAEVPRKVEDDDVLRVLRVERVHQLRRLVAAAVVDEHQLPGFAQARHHIADALIEFFDELFFIVNRRDNRKSWIHTHLIHRLWSARARSETGPSKDSPNRKRQTPSCICGRLTLD